MSEDDRHSRRELLRDLGISIALTTSGAGAVTLEAAQHVHDAIARQRASAPKGEYQPQCFTAHEYQTLRKLSDFIIPADEHSKGALDAGAPEFIDYLAHQSQDLAEIYTGGLAWLDQETGRRCQAAFLDARPEQQTALLDLIAYRRNDSPELAPGIRFFVWVRNMVVDAFYTSPAGIQDLGYMGNGAVSRFSVPEEAIQYALKRSPLA